MQKQFIKIESKGIIDQNAFILLGASTKREDGTKIGFFGSGLKYSIAFLLRKQIEFRVFAEYREIKFNTKPTAFREKSFDVICINEQETSMTTEMGIDWEPWFVLREIYCNALDEGESAISTVNEDEVLPIEDKTVFYILVTPEFRAILNDWKLYFSERRKDILHQDKDGSRIFAGGDKLIVYRKGIRCLFGDNQKCLFNYDLQWVEINESRTIKSEWSFKWDLCRRLQQMKNHNVIAQILNGVNDVWEKGLGWDCSTDEYSEAWLEVINNKTLVPYENAGFWDEYLKKDPMDYIIIPGTLVKGLKTRFAEKVRVIGDVDGVSGTGEFKLIPSLSKRQQSLLDDSVDFLKGAGYEVQYPIKVVDFTAKDLLGQAKDKTILLSVKLFEKGRRELVAGIIEEQEHLVTGFSDETRAFQNHFINKYISALEDKTGRYL